MSAADRPVREPAPWQSYRERQSDGSIPYQECAGCRQAVFSPRVLCPACGSTDLEWCIASGVGIVYSQSFLPGRDGAGHQIVLIDMAEGFRVMGVSVSDDLAIGDRVAGRLEKPAEFPDADPQYRFTKEDAR